MKDSEAHAVSFALPAGFDPTRARQILSPAEDWFLLVTENGKVWTWGKNAPAYVRASERLERELEVAGQLGLHEEVFRIRNSYERLRSAVNEPRQVLCLAEHLVIRIACTWDRALTLTGTYFINLLMLQH